MNERSGSRAGFSQRSEKPGAILVIAENVLAPVSAAQDMVNGSRVFKADITGHAPKPSAGRYRKSTSILPICAD